MFYHFRLQDTNICRAEISRCYFDIKLHLEQVTNKAVRLFWARKGMFENMLAETGNGALVIDKGHSTIYALYSFDFSVGMKPI